jgi:membrane protease subunit HflC
MKLLLRILVGVLVLFFILFQSTTISLNEGFGAVVTHFGKPVRILKDAGLHFRWPWPVDNVYYFDSRKRIFNTRYTQTLTRDKRSIILMTYVVWQIENPLMVLQNLGDRKNVENKLDGLISSVKNNIMGNYDLDALVSTDPQRIKIDEIEEQILASVREKTKQKFGIKINQIGIKRLAFPKNNVAAIFSQMKAERGQYAAKYRAEGRMEAAKIRSDTELEVSKIIAEANKKSEEIKGDADSRVAQLYSRAHEKGRDFYKLKRTLESIEKLVDNNAVFIMRNDRPPFNILYEDREDDR